MVVIRAMSTALVCSNRSDQDICGGIRIKADGTSIDSDHTASSTTPAQQFKFATRNYPQVRHLRTGFSITLDRTDSNPSMAAGIQQWPYFVLPVFAVYGMPA